MTISQVIVTVALLARIYGVDPALMQCIAYRESTYNVNAVNGVHTGPVQFKPTTRQWMLEIAATDDGWLHGDIGAGPVQDVALAAWAIRNGYKNHWSTTRICEEGQ